MKIQYVVKKSPDVDALWPDVLEEKKTYKKLK